jgi:hypothetical protein
MKFSRGNRYISYCYSSETDGGILGVGGKMGCFLYCRVRETSVTYLDSFGADPDPSFRFDTSPDPDPAV